MVELTRLLETQDRLSATIRSLADTLSLTRKSITDKESEIRQIAANPKIVLEYLQLHAEGLQLSRESIRGLGCLFEWPLEFNFAEDFREVSVQGSQTVFRNLKTQETFSVDLSGYSIRRPEVRSNIFSYSSILTLLTVFPASFTIGCGTSRSCREHFRHRSRGTDGRRGGSS